MRYTFGFLIFLLVSCGDSGVERAEVMKIHDDAMARMGEISNSVASLEELLPTSVDSLKIRELVIKLESAEEGMMKWMEAYQEPSEGLDAFYASEMKKVSIVANDINKSLDDAQKYLDK